MEELAQDLQRIISNMNKFILEVGFEYDCE